jgi:NosR/NirI family nitrous oxide reductase transcriptional regulator
MAAPAPLAQGPRRLASRLLAMACLAAGIAHAGTLTKAALQQRFPSPLIVGERDAQLPVWPLLRQDGTATPLVGYAFESIDLAPIPGFSGTPVDLLVLLDAKGTFADVQVLSQHEPVFVDGLGPEPLTHFVEQYRGLSLRQNIKIGSNTNRAEQRGSANVYIDGVAKATASVRIVNQSLLAAALRVARARLGFAQGRDPDQLARVRRDTYRPMDWTALEKAGLVAHLRVTRAQVDRAFSGSGVEDAAPGAPDDPFTELCVTPLSSPLVGRNLLGEAGWSHLQGRLEDGDHALLAISRGPWSFVGDNFVRGAVPDRLVLKQGALPIEMRDLDLDDPLALPSELRGADAKVLRVIGPAGLDPAQAMDLRLHVVREKGLIYPERIVREFTLSYRLPDDQVLLPAAADKSWPGIWRSRARELAVLAVALGVLSVVLAKPRWLVADTRRLAAFRTGYLVFTLVFVGWFAQGQLSVVNLTAAVQAVVAGRGLGFFLYDPMTVVLWVFVAISLVAWGRGTFCGWLCPFGALQELVGQLTRALGLKPRRVHPRIDARLKRVKYGLLAGIVGLAACGEAASAWTDRAVEVEPFKTAITLAFVRSWPFVAWAVALVASSAFVFKGFCRYLCPLGAGLAILGRLRRFDWIARRAECGTPCQSCRHHCDYQAIAPAGHVAYEECFQCLECVAIHASDERCAPLIQHKRHRTIAIRPLPATAARREQALR